MKPFGRFKLHFCTVHRSARRTVEVEIIHLSSAAGYLQTPGWDTYTKQLNEFMRSCVTLTRPTDHVIFVSPVIWSVKSISTYIGQCGLRQRFLKEPKLHSFPLFLFPDDFAKTSNNETHLSFFFSGKYFSWTEASFRLRFSFHLENLKPQQVPSSPPQSHGRKTRWNCSVSVWPDLFDHFPCDLIPQCAESEDEARCNYTTENCGLGKAEISGKCYSFELQVEQHNWTDAHEHCRERGAFLVSLETEQEIRDVVKVMKDIGNSATWVGLTTGTNTVKTSLNAMYQNTLRWDSSNIVFMLPPSVVFDPYTAVATLDCLIFIWTRAYFFLHFQTCDTEEEIGILCELPTSSYHHLAPKPVIIRVPNGTSMSRVPLVTCPLQHMTHELLACDSKSLCNRLESAEEWYRGTCNIAQGQTHEYFYCGTCDDFVPYSVVCDFREDCIGGDDEDFCVHPTCKTHMMDCGKGQCIDSDKRCNGYKDCISNLDEMDCPVEYAISNIIPPAVVNFDKPGGFTITSLPENNTQCPDTHFQCHNDGYCLPVYVKCNDVNDCPDHEDEVECNKYTCPGFYRCRGSDKTICMHVDHLCDGLAQCPMHDDETLCDLICPEACSCFGLAFTCIQPFNFSSFPQLRYLEAKGSGLDQTDVGDNIMLIHLGVTRTKNTGADSIQSKEAAIARRLLTIAMSDFLCWFPIGLCGVLAAMDVIIPGEINVAMAIFVLPLNSALNPFLYTLNVIREKHQKAKELRLLQILRAQQKKAKDIPEAVDNCPLVLEMCLTGERTAGQGTVVGA
ncbi:uncharacterized protein LOC143283464 [Babylonia areolata]|uniref:uncharacterized protein LOC143283464 n=1 Tax=Babylonia areolata TaxID=304850 RepID=UPI003FD22B0F